MQACPVQPQWRRPFPDRLLAAIRLDATVFEEVEHDQEALGQAFWVIVLASLAQGLGGLQASSIPALIGGLAGITLAGILGWIVGTAMIWLIGVKLMGCTSDYQELLRTVGFASAPKVLFLIGVLPLGSAAALLGLAVLILTTIASVLAVRQALDVTTGRAVVVCVVAMVVSFAIAALLGTFIGISMGLLTGDSPQLPFPLPTPGGDVPPEATPPPDFA